MVCFVCLGDMNETELNKTMVLKNLIIDFSYEGYTRKTFGIYNYYSNKKG